MAVISFPIINKPRFADPCNRCGVCCRQTPCLIANAILHQHSGECQALVSHSDGTTSCNIALHPELYLNVGMMRALYKKNGPQSRKLGPDATPSEIVLDALGDSSCDMVQRCDGGVDLDIPMGADIDAIARERKARWMK